MVQLGVHRGLRVIADSSAADEDLVRSLGAHEVIRRGDDIADRIRALVPDGVDGLADGSIQNELLLPAVRDGGGFATVRGFQGPSERGITLHQVWVREYKTELEKLDELRALTESGSVTLRVAATFPADQASEAHRVLEAGGTRGRCVITF